uniref:Uncharacterized mitochondrial protein AtMg00810-like n=1 Tax=Tanacetum cinerariifolium TaxID=118510 RepID=A0A6L2KYG5_TANCI|nr:uncharacterized mitochondrial protein AtMg00810-like [Tanacetum cinerariifolium]
MNELVQVKKEKEGLDNKLTSFKSASKDINTLVGSQRTDKNKEGLGYNAVPPPAQVYSPLKKDMSWTGLPKFADDTVTNYSRPSPNIDSSKSNTSDLQNSNSSISEHGESSTSIMSKPMIKFVKAADFPRVIKTNKTKTTRKSPVKYAEMYRNTSKSPNVRGYWDSGCSQHMTGNISYLSEYEPYDGGYVSFGQGESLGKGWTLHQVTPKECHLYAVKRIFRYLKGHPELGLWYPKESPFDLVAYSDIDYGGATQDRKSTNGGCQFLGRRLISWQCKKQTIVATSTTEAEYVAVASGCGQVLWIQNQLLDYGHALTINPTVYVSHIRQFWSTTRIETTNEETKILATVDAIPIEPHHTPSSQEQHSSHHDTSSPSHPTTTTEPILPTPIETPTKNLTLRQYSIRATRIAQSKALSPVADELAYLLRDDSQGEAFPTVSSLDVGQDRENINKTSAFPHESSPRVTSLDADEGSMQQKPHELMDLCTGLGREDPAQEDAPIKRESMEIREEVIVERSTEVGSNDTEEMVNVLCAMEAANILTSGVAAVSVSPVAAATDVGVPTVSRLVPTVSAIFTTASVRLSEQLARDSEIARLHAEEELKMMIKGLDMSNEMIAKHLHEYKQAGADLSIGEKIKLINELVKYQDHHAKIVKYQAQQRKPLSKKEQREFYMSVLRSHAGWKTRHFRGMTLEEINEKFIPVWKQIEDFVPISSKEEGERMKRKWLKLDQGVLKR